MPDSGFRLQLLAIACINTIICIFLEDIVTEKCLVNFWKKYGQKTKTKYNEVEFWMQNHADWPMISSLPVTKTKTNNKIHENKNYPFTVEVVQEANPKLDFKSSADEINAHSLKFPS